MRLLLASMLLMMLLAASVLPVPTRAQLASPGDDPEALARRVVELTNGERSRVGLLPLKRNDALALSASSHARDMAARNYFSHNSPEGTTARDRAAAAGYPAYGGAYLYVGENLAKGYPTPDEAMEGWLESQAHRDNMLLPQYREMGVGVAARADGTRFWAQEFGSRPGVLPVVINDDAALTDSPEVTLSVASEEVSNWGSLDAIEQMMVSNRPDFADASWEPYHRTKAWMLRAEPGLQRVYVRVRDTRGMAAESSSAIVLLGKGQG